MKGWTRGKKVALVVGAGVLAIVSLVALSWKEIIVRLEVLQLERDQRHFALLLFETTLGIPEERIEQRALDAFLRKRSGKEALFREYEKLVLESVFSNTKYGDLEKTLFEAIIWNTDSHAFYAEWYPPRQLRLPDIALGCEKTEIGPVNERLARLAGEEFRSPRYPHLSFRFLPPAEALKACPRVSPEVRVGGEDEGSRSTMGRVPYVCLAQRDEPEIIRSLTDLLEESRNPNLMVQYLDALGELGPAARKALPAIRALLDEKRGEAWVLEHAESALRRITGGQ